jgi:hypothetical protein
MAGEIPVTEELPISVTILRTRPPELTPGLIAELRPVIDRW